MVSFTTRLTTVSYLSLSIFTGTAFGQNITDDTYFYGQSPSVLPSREIPNLNLSPDFLTFQQLTFYQRRYLVPYHGKQLTLKLWPLSLR